MVAGQVNKKMAGPVQTLIIGRSADADIVLADESVARQHAELVITDDGRFHLTDCGSDGGTWRSLARRGGEDIWERTRQSFVAPSQPLRFGRHRATVRELLAMRAPATEGRAAAAGTGGGRAGAGGLSGAVERDPRTGEIVRRRI